MNISSKKYWESYYKAFPQPVSESLFAKFCMNFLKVGESIIELGCGNGRDTLFFLKNGLNVTGVDQCNSELDFLTKNYSSKNLLFLNDDFTNLNGKLKYDAVYSRFSLHSVDKESEDRVLNWAANSLNDKGRLFIEVRGILDDMYGVGNQVGENEFINGHYRRFIVFDEIKNNLNQLGFNLLFAKQDLDFAPYKTENPVCIRLVAQK